MSQAGIVDFEGSNPQVPTQFDTDGNPAIPIGNILEIIGETVPSITNSKPVFTDGSGNIVTIEVQVAAESASGDINNAGLASFDETTFNVDPLTGFVTLTGGGIAITEIDVDTFTAPGTDPIFPNMGQVKITGAQVASGTVGANVIRTDSLNPSEFTIEIQRSTMVAGANSDKNGVSHFDSASFSVDANGFVSASGTGIGKTITGDDAIALSPTAGNWNIYGSHGLNTSGAGSTLTAAINNAITLGDLSAIAANSNALDCDTGDINLDAGNIKLANANAGLTQGVIKWSNGLRIHNFGTDNTFIGNTAGNGTLSGAINNTGIGLNSLSGLTSGDNNIGVGDNCLRNVSSGGNNVGMGVATLTTLTTSSSCTCIGHGSGNLINGTRNTGLGTQTINKVTTGTDNTAIGYQAGFNYTSTESNNICIGAATTGTLGESGVTRIGSAQTACYIGGIDGINVGSVATVVTESGDKLGTAVITAGTGISVTPGANLITIANTNPSGMPWTDATGATQALVVNNGYITDNAATVVYTLPATASLGDRIKIVGKLGLATITPNANQQILIGSASGTVGVSGTAVSNNVGDCIELICVTAGANTVYRVDHMIGTWTLN